MSNQETSDICRTSRFSLLLGSYKVARFVTNDYDNGKYKSVYVQLDGRLGPEQTSEVIIELPMMGALQSDLDYCNQLLANGADIYLRNEYGAQDALVRYGYWEGEMLLRSSSMGTGITWIEIPFRKLGELQIKQWYKINKILNYDESKETLKVVISDIVWDQSDKKGDYARADKYVVYVPNINAKSYAKLRSENESQFIVRTTKGISIIKRNYFMYKLFKEFRETCRAIEAMNA